MHLRVWRLEKIMCAFPLLILHQSTAKGAEGVIGVPQYMGTFLAATQEISLKQVV